MKPGNLNNTMHAGPVGFPHMLMLNCVLEVLVFRGRSGVKDAVGLPLF